MQSLQPLLFASLLLPACGADDPSSGPVTIETTTVPALVAFRDGADGAWQAVAPKSPTTFELATHGPYMVTVVCDDGSGSITTWQFARTAADPRAIDAPCFASGTTTVSGHMIQAGTVALRNSSFQSDSPDWDFTLSPGNGTFDLVASSSDRIAVRRGLVVNGSTTVMPAIDLAQGSALVAAVPTVTNAVAAESLHTSVYLDTNTTFTIIYSGSPAATKVVPADVLVATDNQGINVTAEITDSSRSVYREHFRPGDSTAVTLPDPIGAVKFDVTGGQLVATWSTLPDHDALDASVFALSTDYSTFWFHDVAISAAFVDATGLTTVPFDVAIPGYKPAWRVDYANEYSVDLAALRHAGNDTAASSAYRNVNTSSSARVRAQRRKGW